MTTAPRHLYMVLTRWAARPVELGPSPPWADHVMMGVLVEGAGQVPRIDSLCASGAYDEHGVSVGTR